MDTVMGKKWLFHNINGHSRPVFSVSATVRAWKQPWWWRHAGSNSLEPCHHRRLKKERKKDILAHAISSLPDLVGLKSLFFQASEQQAKSSWNRPCNTWRTNTGDAEHVCSAQGTCWDDGHVICTLGMKSAVRRKGNKVLGAHNKGLLKVCLLAVVRPKGSVCMVSSNQVPQRIWYEDHLKQITTREAE